jgi:hypothetical protein
MMILLFTILFVDALIGVFVIAALHGHPVLRSRAR